MSFQPFHLAIPLPLGATLVQASAGTGKTWSIARLVARVLVEASPEGGDPPSIDQVLVVTFTKAATAELRDRVRDFLFDAATGLRALLASGDRSKPDEAGLAVLAGAASDAPSTWVAFEDSKLEHRAVLLERAVRDFDTAAISTIHGFCARMLQYLAFESMSAFDAELIQDDSELIEEVVDDWMAVNMVHPSAAMISLLAEVGWTRGGLVALARSAIGSGGAEILPGPVDLPPLLETASATAESLLHRVEGADGQALLQCLKTRVNANSYKSTSIDRHWPLLAEWLRGDEPPEATRDWLLKYIDPDRFRAAAKVKGSPPPSLLCDLAAYFLMKAELGGALLGSFAHFVASEHTRRLGLAQQQTYDDLLAVVARGLQNPALVAGMRARFHAALIDEFQDTDATQWQIFSTLFPPNAEDGTQDEAAGPERLAPRRSLHGRLLLIGDPKQAIYSFRGADVSVYTLAVERTPANARFTMTHNFRSDRPLVETLNALFHGAPNIFCTDAIAYERVTARHDGPRLLDAAGLPVPPLELRWFDKAVTAPGQSGPLSNGDADRALPRVVAEDVCQTLRAGWQVREACGDVPLSRRHIAVLVRKNKEAKLVHAELLARGVPAVLGGAGSVLDTDEARWMLYWLDALTADRVEAPARTLLLTPLFAWTAAELLSTREADATTDPQDGDRAILARWTDVTDRLRAGSKLLTTWGVARAATDLLDRPTESARPESPTQRIARLRDGERRLTNLRHLVELLHGAEVAGHLGPRGVYAWFADRIARGDTEEGTAELRLESDADTVKVVTLHKSKGLEYPVVFTPSLANGRLQPGLRPGATPIRFHRGHKLYVDLRGEDGADPDDVATSKQEVLQENQRLLYVAMTRARHRVVVYVGPLKGQNNADYSQSSLGLLLHGRGPEGDRTPRASLAAARIAPALKDDPAPLREALDVLCGEVPGLTVSDCSFVPRVPAQPFDPVEVTVGPCAVFPAGRGFDDLWRRESYSGLVGSRHGSVVEGPDERGGADEPEDHAPVDDPGAAEDYWPPEDPADVEPDDAATPNVEFRSMRLPDPEIRPGTEGREEALAGFARGKKPGLWVHAVFEDLSFPTGTPRATTQSTAALIRQHGQRQGFPTSTIDPVLERALPGMLSTPLGPEVGGLRLRDIPDACRLNEAKFDIGIGPGDAWDDHAAVRGEELVDLLSHRTDGSPLPQGYFDWLRGNQRDGPGLRLRSLCGFLTGSIDLVFRADVDGRPRWFVADYKTNRLRPGEGGWSAPSREGHYGQAWMCKEIVGKNYYIQYMLYSVAVHRYLRSRLRDYDYDRDFGGVLYLFLRGMLGEDTARDPDGHRNGVYFDRPARQTIEAISALFSRNEKRS